MNILLVVENFPPNVGGIQTEFWEFARHLAKLGHSVRVATSTSGGLTGLRNTEQVEIYHYHWLSFFDHPIGRKLDIMAHAAWADIVHTTTYSTALPSLAAARYYKKPCVLSVQEVIGKRWYSLIRNPLLALSFHLFEKFLVTRKFSAWHAISDATRSDTIAAGVSSTKIKTIHLGIDTIHWDHTVNPLSLCSLFGFPPNSRVLLFLGRPGKTKGADLIIDAARLVKHKLPSDVRIGFIMSDSPPGERGVFIRRLTSAGFSDVAKVVPSVSYANLPRYVKDAFCVIVPSRTEGFGFVAAEACQLKVPIISSDAGSLPEVVSGRYLFFKNGDSYDLAKQLLLACENRFLTKQPKTFSWELAAQELCLLYQLAANSLLDCE